MSTIIADNVWKALSKLTTKEKARVTDFIGQFMQDPGHQSIRPEPLNTPSKNVWSGRITQELRAILFKDGGTWAIVHVGHHDAAYDWAKRKSIGRHSITGALQIVESNETIREVERVIEVRVAPELPPVFKKHSDEYLISLGLPETWLPALRLVRDDEQLLMLCEKLPDEIASRLIDVAGGMIVTPPMPVSFDRPMTDAEDTNRRFFLLDDTKGLAAALEGPMHRWLSFLHPTQQALVQKDFKGPSKVSGSAGTGKTVVAMHRARALAAKGERVFLTSYAKALCENISVNLNRLCTAEERKQITVSTFHKQALDIVRKVEPKIEIAKDAQIHEMLEEGRLDAKSEYDEKFVQAEWDAVIRIQGIQTWNAYRDAKRTGRGRGLSVKQRLGLWKVFGGVFTRLENENLLDWPGVCSRASEVLESGKVVSEFTSVIVDEVQDLSPPALLFLRNICTKPENLMLCGDAGQRIYAGNFSLKSLGINVVGRSTVLRLNYRTTEQIRRVADALLSVNCDDMNGGTESRAAESVLRGPSPVLVGYDAESEETTEGIGVLKDWLASGLAPNAIGVFCATKKELKRFRDATEDAGISTRTYRDPASKDQVCVGTMHSAKGLEFKCVLVLGCAKGKMPNSFILSKIQDPMDRENREAREQRLLYVAMTRARDELVVSWAGKPSPFLSAVVNKDGGRDGE